MKLAIRVQRLLAKIRLLNEALRTIQDSVCDHPAETLERKNGSNTGNYDPMADRYWIDWRCGVCEKRWTTDQ